MSEALDALLNANIVDEEQVYIPRLKTYFTVKSITNEELTEASEEASYFVGKGKKRKKEVDENKLGALIIAKACKDPDFGDKQLLEKFDAVSIDEVVMRALRPGEISEISSTIMELSGFFSDDETEEDVKNS